jgi:hypothetical protein
MRNYIKIFVGLMVAWGMLTSCNKKKNDWNLNGFPTVTLDSVEARAMNAGTFSTLTLPAGDLVLDTNSQVRMHFTVKSENKIKQISFHDGTWGGNMSMITSAGIVAATPPESIYRPENPATTEKFIINFTEISGNTIYTMMVFDPHGQATSYVFKMRPKDK